MLIKKILKGKSERQIADFLVTKRISKGRKGKMSKKYREMLALVESFIEEEPMMLVLQEVAPDIAFKDGQLVPVSVMAESIIDMLPHKTDSYEEAYAKSRVLARFLLNLFDPKKPGYDPVEKEEKQEYKNLIL